MRPLWPQSWSQLVLQNLCACATAGGARGGGGWEGGEGFTYTTVVPPFPDWADVALPLCWSHRQAAGAGPYSLFNSAGLGEPFHLLHQEG